VLASSHLPHETRLEAPPLLNDRREYGVKINKGLEERYTI